MDYGSFWDAAELSFSFASHDIISLEYGLTEMSCMDDDKKSYGVDGVEKFPIMLDCKVCKMRLSVISVAATVDHADYKLILNS